VAKDPQTSNLPATTSKLQENFEFGKIWPLLVFSQSISANNGIILRIFFIGDKHLEIKDTKMIDKSNNKYLALPASGKGPGILVLHAWWGLNNFFKDFCQRLADQGFVALAPDLYHGKIASTIEDAENMLTKTNRKLASVEILEAHAQLRALPNLTGSFTGVVGFSMGAFWSCWLAQQKPENIKAVTLFYGSKNGDFSHSQAAFLGHFAESDKWEPASGVKKLEKSLRTAQRPVTFHTYPATGHWFFEKDRPDSFDAQAAQLAWERTISFFHTQLDDQNLLV